MSHSNSLKKQIAGKTKNDSAIEIGWDCAVSVIGHGHPTGICTRTVPSVSVHRTNVARRRQAITWNKVGLV